MAKTCGKCGTNAPDTAHECPRCLATADDGFLTSMVIGMATDNAILGGLMGGNMCGGIIGDIMNGGDVSCGGMFE